MKEEIKALQDERVQIYKDFYNNTIPKRIPISLSIPDRVVAARLGLSGIDIHYSPSVLDDEKRKLASMFYSDSNPFSAGATILSRGPGFFNLMKSQSFVMAQNGFMQHPEVIGMFADEYQQLIDDPMSLLYDVVIPRQYKTFGMNAAAAVNYFNMGMAWLRTVTEEAAPVVRELNEEYGYWPGAPRGSSTGSVAPYDFIADQLRSFSEISKDIRRNREQVKEACDALVPLMFDWGMPTAPDRQGMVRIPLHMPTFMREKDFSELWMPSFLRLAEQWAARGVRTRVFCEDDWTRLLDSIQDMPYNSEMQFEYGDFQTIKDKVGPKYIITGMFPLHYVGRATVEEMLDKAKEMLDIMMPGGGYLWGFDKGPLYAGDINIDNYAALGEFVRDYAVYDNAGESYGKPTNYENYAIDPSIEVLPDSPYIFNWDRFKKEYPLVPDSAEKQFKLLQKAQLDTMLQLLR
ncbi:MAG: hypothetical protein FWG10_03775 [Eubacteriaceae bacterium]|nr:hypothetical protein [Eubacteriaceae bacterium]